MNEAGKQAAEWIAMTPDRVLLVLVLVAVIWYLFRKTDRQSEQLKGLHKTSEERGVEMAEVVGRNNTLFEQVMKRLGKE